MRDLFGLLVSLPTESVAVRATVGSLVGVAVTAVLLGLVLRRSRVRVAAALVPIGAIIGAVIASWAEPRLPMIMMATEGMANQAEHAYGPFLVRDTYVHFAPLAWPLFAIWAAIAGWKITRRVAVMRRMELVATGGAAPRDLRVAPLLERVSARIGVPAPRVVVVRGCPGGAALVGTRTPTLVVDAAILGRLDDDELEGLLAHELAHVRRRDNLLALIVGLVRDMLFFVPGGRWVTRRLCVERELAADDVAVAATARPGALASGLLKAIDVGRPGAVCAAFAAPAAMVTRVERLVAEDIPEGRLRTTMETALVAGALAASVGLAIQLPAVVAAQAEDGWGRNAVALVWTWGGEVEAVQVTDPVVFDVYRRSTSYQPLARGTSSAPSDAGREFHPAVLRGEQSVIEGNEVHTRPIEAWRTAERQVRTTPLVAASDGVGVFWLHEVRAAP